MAKGIMGEILENSINRILEIVGKNSDEIYEQGNIEISVDDVFAIQCILNELLSKEDHINFLNREFNRKLENKQETINYYRERVRELEKNDKIIDLIKNYAQEEIDNRTEGIEDYTDDDEKGNKDIIGELKEDREHWKDIIRIMNNEKTYINFNQNNVFDQLFENQEDEEDLEP